MSPSAAARLLPPAGRAATAFSPVSAFTWHSLYWASDPSWTAPADGAAATTWRDASGNSRTLTASSTGPIYRAAKTGLGSRPCLDFAGAASSVMTTASFALAQPFSIVMIGLWPAVSGEPLSSLGTTSVQWFGPSGAGLYSGTTLVVGTNDGTAKLTYAYHGGASGKGGHGSATNAGNIGTNGFTAGLKLGAIGNASSTFFTGSQALVGIYSGDITAATNWAAFKSWASSFYGAAV